MKYTTPAVEVEMFEIVDVIRTSDQSSQSSHSGPPQLPDETIEP